MLLVCFSNNCRGLNLSPVEINNWFNAAYQFPTARESLQFLKVEVQEILGGKWVTSPNL